MHNKIFKVLQICLIVLCLIGVAFYLVKMNKSTVPPTVNVVSDDTPIERMSHPYIYGDDTVIVEESSEIPVIIEQPESTEVSTEEETVYDGTEFEGDANTNTSITELNYMTVVQSVIFNDITGIEDYSDCIDSALLDSVYDESFYSVEPFKSLWGRIDFESVGDFTERTVVSTVGDTVYEFVFDISDDKLSNISIKESE